MANPDKNNKAFLACFLTAAIGTWLPTKIIGYFLPFICFFVFILISNNKIAKRRFIFIFLGLLLFILLNYLLRPNYLLHSGLLSLITYAAIIIILIIPSDNYMTDKVSDTYYKYVVYFIIIQSIVGFIQLIVGMNIRNTNLDADTGDVVQGTINPFSFMPDTAMGFGNQMFVINLLMMITFIAPMSIKKRNLLPIIIGFFAVTFASVLHLTASWLASLTFVILFFNPNIFNRYLFLLVFILGLSTWIVYYSQPDNFSLIGRYLAEYLSGESLKVIATYQAIIEMPIEYPYTHFTGVGLGQFSSKAGLIGTGQYFGEFYNPTQIPFLPQKVSLPFQKYGYDLWEYTNKPDIIKWINSTMNRTFYSLLSLYSELGAIIFALILFQFSKTIFFFRRLYLTSTFSTTNKLIALSTAANCLFIFFISFFENYLESAQAIFVGLFLIKLHFGYLKTEKIKQKGD